MLLQNELFVSEIMSAGLNIIKNTALTINRTHLQRYLENYLKIYQKGIDTIDIKIQLYLDLYDAKIETLKIPPYELPGGPDFRKKLKHKITELKEKKEEIINAAKNLPDKLPLLNEDDPDFQKILMSDIAWYSKNGCLVLGMCICDESRHTPYKSTCLPPGKDFSIL